MSNAQPGIRLDRLLAGLLAVVCALLIGCAGLQVSDMLLKARIDKLAAAEQAITQGAIEFIEQDRIPGRLVRAVEAQVADPRLNISFVTLRNLAGVTLVSRGTLGPTGLGWIPFGDGRAWRSWIYRTTSAQTNRVLTREGQRVGSAHFGVAWKSIAYQAGFPLFIWASALLAGVIGLLGALLRLTARRDARVPLAAAPMSGARSPKSTVEPAMADRLTKPVRARRGRRRGASDKEFAPIGGGERLPPASASGARAAPGLAAAGAAPPRPASTADMGLGSLPPSAIMPARPAPEPMSTALDRSFDTPAAPVFEAPRIDARPALGDSTLDLRFYPIWRGQGSDRLLAGAYAAMAWRTGAAELVAPETLIRLAERDGALRAFTQWIARRLSLLHANWRTLELATVPIVLPIPSAMLGFADAEAVWRDALRRTDRDSDDLILSLDSETARTYAALPVRRILPLAGPTVEPPRDCDLLGVAESLIDGHASAWRARVDSVTCPILFGPLETPERYADLLERPGALWFSDRPEQAHPPRAFARLLMRQATAPIH